MVMSKEVSPWASVEGRGAGVTSRLPTRTRVTGTKFLKPPPLTVTVEPAEPLVSERLMVPSGTSWVTVVITGVPGFPWVAPALNRTSTELVEGMVALVGIRSSTSKLPLASGVAVTRVASAVSYTHLTLPTKA